MIASPDEEGKEEFFLELKSIMPDAVVLSAIEKSTQSQPRVRTVNKLPTLLSSLYHPKYSSMSKKEILCVCNEIMDGGIKVTKEEALYLEETTRLQSLSLVWAQHRVGRITASRFGAVYKARISPPPVSLIQQLMGENCLDPIKVPSLKWGIDNESIAREAYIEQMRQCHSGFAYTPAGLFVNPEFPHLGATPDGIISCDCCGDGIIEIKCPYKYRQCDPNTVVDKDFYIKENEEDPTARALSQDHDYFIQVQGQLVLCEKEYCDFICWTPFGMHTERIERQQSLFDKVRKKLDDFFRLVLLPRILRGELIDLSGGQTKDNAQVYCWCQQEEFGQMIACDNPTCRIEWFHFSCVGLSRKPKGRWYCSDKCKENHH